VATVAQAHHSFGLFDLTVRETIEGDVVDVEWTNPHTWVWVNVTNSDGNVTKWGLEGRSPNVLNRTGWTRTTLKAGDHIKAAIAPLRTGQPGGALLSVELPDGKKMIMYEGVF
jgi:hypothetical protein